jgi:PAS domain-containing protein
VRDNIIERKPNTNLKTKQQLLLEMKELRTRLDATERRLQEANEILQAQTAERKQAEQTFEKARKYAESIVKTIREPLTVLTPDLRVITGNRSFYEMFNVMSERIEGRFVFSKGDHVWDIPVFFLLQGNEFFDKLVS